MAIGEPDEATLEAFLADHAAEFEAPEYRDLELVLLAPEDLHDEIEPSEAEIEAAYRFHEDRYRTPAERRALQLLAPSRELAATAAALRREGADRAALEAELGGQGLSVSEIGPVTPGSLPAALDAALFALGQGELGEPVESAFGWHVFEVLEARAATVRSLDEVRDELVAELRHEQAIERLPRVADALDDVLAGDPPLAEAAEAVGARHLRLPAVDRDGRDATGAPVTPRLDPEILAAAFTAQVGDVSLLEQTRDGTYYVIALRGITPARTRTLAEARDGIAAAWRRAERAAAARATAERLLERVQAGVTPDSLTGEGVELRELGPVTRSARQPATAAVAALFAAAPGAAPQAVVELPEGAALIWLDEVIPAAPEAVAEQVREELLAARREALILQYERSLRDRYPVSVNERSFAALIER
jgi:peptidyl-prolyl cis-trans isomerase D